MTLLAVFTLSAVAGDAAEDLDADVDADLDLDNLEDEFDPDTDLDDEEVGVDGVQGGPPVDDFDLGLADTDKKFRMKSCFGFTVARAQANRDKIDEMTQGLAAQRQISTEQAVNSILFSWAMTCYLNSEEPQLKQVTASMSTDGGGWSEDYEPLVFQQRPDRAQQVQSASEKQWKLLESIVVEHSKEQRPSGGGARGGGGGGERVAPATGLPGGSMSSQSSALYMLIVFGAFFGVGALSVTKLSRGSTKAADDKTRSGKSAKKAEKQEKLLARKRNM